MNRIDVQLAVGEVTEKVEVRAEVAALAADKPDVHVDLGSQEIVNLPLPNYRNFQSLLNLVPGASPGKFQNTIFGSPGRSYLLVSNYSYHLNVGAQIREASAARLR